MGPRAVDWPLDPPRNENWIKRYGFPLVPDFAATVHAVTGGQLTTCIGDMDAYDVTPSEEDAVKGYIIMSRVEYADKIALAQSFHRHCSDKVPSETQTSCLMFFVRR